MSMVQISVFAVLGVLQFWAFWMFLCIFGISVANNSKSQYCQDWFDILLKARFAPLEVLYGTTFGSIWHIMAQLAKHY